MMPQKKAEFKRIPYSWYSTKDVTKFVSIPCTPIHIPLD